MSGRLEALLKFVQQALIEPLGRLVGATAAAVRALFAIAVRRRRRLVIAGLLSPGADDPEEGYVEFAGFAPGSKRLLIAREVKDRGRFRRRFEELRLDDLALVHQASRPEILRDFGWLQEVATRPRTD